MEEASRVLVHDFRTTFNDIFMNTPIFVGPWYDIEDQYIHMLVRVMNFVEDKFLMYQGNENYGEVLEYLAPLIPEVHDGINFCEERARLHMGRDFRPNIFVMNHQDLDQDWLQFQNHLRSSGSQPAA